MKWESYKHEFEFDGSWLDIYVLNVEVADWRLTVDMLESKEYQHQLYINGEKSSFPLSAEDIIDKRDDIWAYASFKVNSIQLNCHFFDETQIEFDLDPRDVKSELEAQHIFSFMRRLGQLLNREVILTPENSPQIPIFKFSLLTNQIEHIAP